MKDRMQTTKNKLSKQRKETLVTIMQTLSKVTLSDICIPTTSGVACTKQTKQLLGGPGQLELNKTENTNQLLLYSHRQKKLDTSLNRHKIISIKDKIDWKIGSKAEIH